MNDDLIQLRPQGLYCPPGDFYIDPWRPVATAVITHGHADHARTGMGRYHCTDVGLPILQWRLGNQDYRPHAYGQAFHLGPIQVSLHPAGHVRGSAQVRVQHEGRVWVFSGDFKRQPDPSCAPFEVVACDTFITEATFAFPVYRWPPMAEVVAQIDEWRTACAQRGEAAILYAYALGKSQRLLAELKPVLREPVWLHGALERGVAIYRDAGVPMADTQLLSEVPPGADVSGRLVLAPPSAADGPWLKRFPRAQQALASGWMQLRGNRRRRNLDRGFVVSDHADWPALLRTLRETGAARVLATHGNTELLLPLLREQGLDAQALATPYGDAQAESEAPTEGPHPETVKAQMEATAAATGEQLPGEEQLYLQPASVVLDKSPPHAMPEEQARALESRAPPSIFELAPAPDATAEESSATPAPANGAPQPPSTPTHRP